MRFYYFKFDCILSRSRRNKYFLLRNIAKILFSCYYFLFDLVNTFNLLLYKIATLIALSNYKSFIATLNNYIRLKLTS